VRLPLSTLDVLDGGGPSATKTWANDLLDLGFIDDAIVDLAVIDDDDWERSQRLVKAILKHFDVHETCDAASQRLRIEILVGAFEQRLISPRALLSRLLALAKDHTALGQLWAIDEVITWAVPASTTDPDARHWVESLAAEGLDPLQPDLWLERKLSDLLPTLRSLRREPE